jgi:NMD protein affecting ribosome stability and mRNA decay
MKKKKNYIACSNCGFTYSPTKHKICPKCNNQEITGKETEHTNHELQKISGYQVAPKNTFTKEESGVRNLKRCLEIIYTKLNLFRLIKPENNIFAKQMDIEVTFPFTVTKKHVDTLIKNEEHQNQSLITMYI